MDGASDATNALDLESGMKEDLMGTSLRSGGPEESGQVLERGHPT